MPAIYLIDSPKKVDKYISNFIKKHKKWLIQNRYDINIEIQQLQEKLHDIDTFQKEREDLEYSEIDKRNGILSLSGRWDSILMWSHYGNFHKGFCIGFNELKMRNCGLFERGGLVIYSEKFPELNPLILEEPIVTSFYQIHYKSKEWEYEEEYRLTNFYFPNYPEDKDRVINIPEEFIEEVILGLNISTKYKNEIVDECKKRNIKVFQISKIPFKFGMVKTKI